jgi:hypothetical protein
MWPPDRRDWVLVEPFKEHQVPRFQISDALDQHQVFVDPPRAIRHCDALGGHPPRTAGGALITAKFTGRLQLAPGLVPPTSWSFPPLRPPKIYCRAESLKSPEPGPIYPMSSGSTRNFAVYGGSCDLPQSKSFVARGVPLIRQNCIRGVDLRPASGHLVSGAPTGGASPGCVSG